MKHEDRSRLKRIIEESLCYVEKNNFNSPIFLARFGNILRKVGENFTPQEYGFANLQSLLGEFPEVVSVCKHQGSGHPIVVLHDGKNNAFQMGGLTDAQEEVSHEDAFQLNEGQAQAALEADSKVISLYDFAFVASKKWLALADLAVNEDWGGGEDLPILKSYIFHTFTRLQHECKVLKLNDKFGKKVASFNTGLVDRRYRQIYAFFEENTEGKSEYFLKAFCCSGEGREGQSLVGLFNPLPISADYLKNPRDAVYDINSRVEVNWDHVIVDNFHRIPREFLQEHVKGFDFPNDLNESSINQYKSEFKNYLQANEREHRSLISSFSQALDLAQKKAHWNYKTAVPIYYPSKNIVTLLLPLCLVSDDNVDLALVVERQESGNYLGRTIYPLDWAYKAARLIAQPNSEWLKF